MKRNLIPFTVILLFSILTFSSCSKFSKIQKSTDMEAKYQAAVKYYEKKSYFQALQLFEELITVFRGTNRAEETYFYYAQCYFETGDYTIAAYHFNNFNQTFPGSAKAEEALFKNAYCYYLDSPVSSLDQKNTLDAIRQFQLFVNRYPQSDKVQNCNQLIDELRLKLETKEFNNAKLYFKTGQNKAALTAFQNVIKSYPSSIYKEECLYYAFRSAYLYANQSIDSKKAERYKYAIESYYKLIDAFPSGKFNRDAEKIFLECQDRLKKLEKSANLI
ncbi:MAG: outer membrane protein assembly factor BamD [Bacteroidia bacterium]|nr:outer membrane protein assembly factor BamD [Bacteroidia bacterium]